jgi:cysteine desulfurase/selenocysteine lyase
VIIDAAQTMAHQHQLLIGTQPDAICFSAHKMYAASLGGIVIRKDLLNSLQTDFIGGGMVSGVKANGFSLIPDEPETKLEPGLQAWGEIAALGAAVKWLNTVKPNGQDRHDYIIQLSQQLFDGLKTLKGVTLINQTAAPVISMYSEKYDAHRLALFLSAAGIMVRSGYFCCHYYLIEQRQLPPLVRFSLGLHATPADIDKRIQTLQKLIGKA